MTTTIQAGVSMSNTTEPSAIDAIITRAKRALAMVDAKGVVLKEQTSSCVSISAYDLKRLVEYVEGKEAIAAELAPYHD